MPKNEILPIYKDEPRVSLGGCEWAVPPLSGRRIIRFGSLATSVASIKATMPEAEILKIYEAIFTGISQGLAKDSLKFDQWLDDYPIVFSEVIEALPVVARQAGMEMAKPGDAAGEAEAALIVDGNS